MYLRPQREGDGGTGRWAEGLTITPQGSHSKTSSRSVLESWMWKPSLAPPVEAIWSQALAQHHDENVAGTLNKVCQRGQRGTFHHHCSHTGKARGSCRVASPTSHNAVSDGEVKAGREPELPASKKGKTQGQFIPELTQTGVNLDQGVSILEATPRINRKSSPQGGRPQEQGTLASVSDLGLCLSPSASFQIPSAEEGPALGVL